MYTKLIKELSADIVLQNEPMKKHTSFKIGGPADLIVFPRNIDELQTAIKSCMQNNYPLFIFGLGSNILVRDKGIRGVVIKIGNQLKKVEISDEEIFAEAGIRLSELSKKAAAASLSGLEFAEGIPGSLGGAIMMNAGAYGGEMQQIITAVEAIDPAGVLKTYTADSLGFAYRKSIFQDNDNIIISARMKLKKGNQENIYKTMKKCAVKRREKQPLEYPSAGSVFRRPSGYYVGPILEELGLKGYSVGGAQVSAKHAGFIINAGNAKASDVLELINFIQEKVRNKYNIDLKTEIKIVGEQ